MKRDNIFKRHKIKSKLATEVKGDQKAPFSIATILMWRRRRNSFPSLIHFILDTYLILLSVKQWSYKYNFLSLWYDATWDWTLVSQTIGKLK